MSRPTLVTGLLLTCCSLAAAAAPATHPALQHMTWQVDGVTREALVYLPPKSSTPAPLIFAFHGHGGTSRFAARKFNFPSLWPDAICVYPQGIPTRTPNDPRGERAGWQPSPGRFADRDLHFYDAMLHTFLTDHHADPKNVFVTGHSNGAFFTYALLAARPDTLTAIAPIAGLLNERELRTAKPKPILHVAGQQDPIVPYAQQLLTIDRDLALNHCDPTAGQPAGPLTTLYPSKDPNGPPVLTLIHPAGHQVPKEALPRIAEFFQQQAKK